MQSMATANGLLRTGNVVIMAVPYHLSYIIIFIIVMQIILASIDFGITKINQVVTDCIHRCFHGGILLSSVG